MLMFYIKEFVLDIKFLQSFNPKSECSFYLALNVSINHFLKHFFQQVVLPYSLTYYKFIEFELLTTMLW
jgi:hypothetical protein